jgi:molybdenum cofactor biosynthesis enzyme MoaA
MVSSSDLLSRISDHYPELIRIPDELNDTARSWSIPGHNGTFGFISSMSDHFCSTCNRLRITADGKIKVRCTPNHLCSYTENILLLQVCLFDAKEVSLRDQMRRGATDAELLRVIRHAVLGKQEKHVGMENIDVVTNRPMILIGG